MAKEKKDKGPGWGERKAREIIGRSQAQAEEFVRPELEEGEDIAAVLVNASNKDAARTAPLGVAANLVGLRVFTVVVTNRRVLFVRVGGMKGEPRAIEQAVPRDQVRVVEYQHPKRGMRANPRLVLEVAGHQFVLAPPTNYNGAQEVHDALTAPRTESN